MIPKATISMQRTKELHDAIREQERQLLEAAQFLTMEVVEEA